MKNKKLALIVKAFEAILLMCGDDCIDSLEYIEDSKAQDEYIYILFRSGHAERILATGRETLPILNDIMDLTYRGKRNE